MISRKVSASPAPSRTNHEATSSSGVVAVSKKKYIVGKIKSGTQTLTVKTDKVRATITPAVAGTSTATPDSSQVAPADSLPVSDWSGFIAPKVSYVKMLSCVKSTTKEISGLTGALAYSFTIIEQLKLTGGHFNYNGKIYSPSDVLYVSYTPYTLSTNSMDLSMGMPDSAELYFSPFNWKTNGGGPAGGGVSDFGPDASYKMIDFTYIFHSTQAECDSLPKP